MDYQKLKPNKRNVDDMYGALSMRYVMFILKTLSFKRFRFSDIEGFGVLN